jgi:hypothetical protein
VLDAQVIGRVFYDAARPVRVDLLARAPPAVAVALVRLVDAVAVPGWPPTLAPGVVSSVLWDGGVAGVPQPAGRYELRVFAGGADVAAVAASAPETLPAPPSNTSTTGSPSAAAALSARAGRLRRRSRRPRARGPGCVRPLRHAAGRRAERVVKLNRFQSAAGNYLVVDGDGTVVDYADMPLRDPSPPRQGRARADGTAARARR